MDVNLPLVSGLPQNGLVFNVAAALVIVLGSVVLAKILDRLIGTFLKKQAELTESEVDDKLVKIIHGPLYHTIILIGLLIGLKFVIPLEYQGTSETFISILIILIVTKVVFSSVDVIFHDIAKKLASKTKSTLDDEAIPFLSKIAKAIILLVALLLILGKLGFTEVVITSVAGLGILGFAVGFAAKDTLANMLSGFFILTDRPFKRRDRIEVGNYMGEVVDIGLRTTKILTLDKNYVIIPNSKISSTEVINYTKPNVRIKLKLPIGVAYGSDPKKVKKIILETAKKCEWILDEPAPAVYFTEFGDSSINFLLRIWVQSFMDRVRVKDFIHSQLYDKFKKEKIEIPFPCRTVYLRK